MNTYATCKKICPLFLIMMISVSSPAQQKFSITSSRDNNYCNSTCTLLDNPDLNGNPTAIVFITPVLTKGININPHPICAYYNGRQWSIMNVDNSSMPPGAQFNVQYFSGPDDTHFVHAVTKENLVRNISYIDHAGMNGNPGAKFNFIQNASPNVRGGKINTSDIKFQYDEAVGKWGISNNNGSTIDIATGYSISITEVTVAATVNSTPATTSSVLSSSFIPGAKADNSGQRVFMSVQGQIQGLFLGEAGSNRMELSSFEMENVSPRDIATGQASGKRQHVPVFIQKATGASSIQFFKSFTSNEKLITVTIEVYKVSAASAGLELSYKIVLTNAALSTFKQSFADGGNGFTDSIKLFYQSIELINVNGGVTANDTWPSLN